MPTPIRPLPPMTPEPQKPSFPSLDGVDLLFGPEPSAKSETVDRKPVLDGVDLLFGTGAGVQPQAIASAPAQEQSWGQWASDAWHGKQDQNEAGTGTVFDQHRDVLGNPTANAANFGASDAQMGDVVQKALGERFVRREKDANGYDVFVTRGPDGREQRGYLNKPGIDMQDVTRGIRGALPYIGVGSALGAATKGAGLGLQMLSQGAGAGATSVAGDAAQVPMGSKQGIELGKAGTMTAFGAGGPLVGTVVGNLWRRFVTIPGLVDKTTGQLTAKGIEAAKRAGIDPSDITPDFSKRFADSYARTGDEMMAVSEAERSRFGIPATRGQVSKDPYLLTQEEGMRRKLYGEKAQATMRAFDERQKDAIASAALGNEGIGGVLNPSRKPLDAPFERSPGVLGENVQSGFRAAQSGADAAEAAAWKGTTGLTATKPAFDTLPAVLQKNLVNVTVDTQLTPAAARMGQELDRFIAGEAPEAVAGVLKQAAVQDVGQMRKRLLGFYGAAQTGEDKRAAKAIYDGFNDWIGEAASKNLLAGDPAAAMNMVKARGFTKEVRDLFSPSVKGKLSPAASRLAKIENADSGEGVIQSLFGSQGSRGVSDGSVEALRSLKTALDRFASKEVAEQAWNDVRLAYWTRLVSGKNGELVGPTAMMNNIKSAINSQRSVFNTLYSPSESREIAQFVRALDAVSYKPPNASGSGYTAASFAKEGIMKLLDSFGLGTPVRAALDYTGIGSALQGASARNAVSQVTKPIRPNLTPYITGSKRSIYGSEDQSKN